MKAARLQLEALGTDGPVAFITLTYSDENRPYELDKKAPGRFMHNLRTIRRRAGITEPLRFFAAGDVMVETKVTC